MDSQHNDAAIAELFDVHRILKANHVFELSELSSVGQWQYTAMSANPADANTLDYWPMF